MYLIFQWCWLQVTKAIEFHITHLFFLQPTEYFSKKYTKTKVMPAVCRHYRRWRLLICASTLQWCHNGRDSVSNHKPYDCFLIRLFRHRSKKTSKLRVIGLCAWNSPGAGEFPAQMASNAENVSIWWRHHEWRLSWYHDSSQVSVSKINATSNL